jgi:hypothetical protein
MIAGLATSQLPEKLELVLSIMSGEGSSTIWAAALPSRPRNPAQRRRSLRPGPSSATRGIVAQRMPFVPAVLPLLSSAGFLNGA